MSSARLGGGEKSEALHLRAMRQKNQSLPLNKKAQDLCQVHKNRQNSVEFIPSIRLHVGMDARDMKKQILFDALDTYGQMLASDTVPGLANLPGAFTRNELERVAKITDRERTQVTRAMLLRFRKVFEQMLADAESKI